MAVFGSLNEKLSHIFSKLTKRGKLTELEIKNAMRELLYLRPTLIIKLQKILLVMSPKRQLAKKY